MKTKLFPTIIVDDFLDNPDELINFSKNLDFYYDEKYLWPGIRTRPLYEIDKDLFIFLGNKILYSYGLEKFEYNAEAEFQLVNKNYYSGWIHRDSPRVLTSIIYLNKKGNINSGTSLYKPIENYEKMQSNVDIIFKCRRNFIKNMAENDNYIITKKEKDALKWQHEFYEEVLNVKNLYNRMFTFESGIWHSANEYPNETMEPRLTLVYFFFNIDTQF